MSRIAYIERNFRAKSLEIIGMANAICEDYARQGYDLTLRQLYYQFISRDFFPNSEKSYDNLGSVINDARLAGYIDWNHLTDRGRTAHSQYHQDDPHALLDDIEYGIHLDRWETQDLHLEIWVEKQALESVVQRSASAMDCTYLACKGYMSQSEMHSAAMRMLGKIQDGKRVVLLHLGDHDPSGIDMTRDNRDRLTLFIGHHIAEEYGFDDEDGTPTMDQLSEAAAQLYGCVTDDADVFEIRRIALNMDQIRQYNPPPNPAKLTDSRAGDYIAKYGRSSWELDALPPNVLDALIRDEIRSLIDADAWNAVSTRETGMQAAIKGWIDQHLPELDELTEGL